MYFVSSAPGMNINRCRVKSCATIPQQQQRQHHHHHHWQEQQKIFNVILGLRWKACLVYGDISYKTTKYWLYIKNSPTKTTTMAATSTEHWGNGSISNNNHNYSNVNKNCGNQGYPFIKIAVSLRICRRSKEYIAWIYTVPAATDINGTLGKWL